jgi:hypothetical protein
VSNGIQRALTGFSAGVMLAASVWSLLIPAIEQSAALGKWSFVPAVADFWIGVLFLLLLDHVIPHLHRNSEKAEGPRIRLQKTTILVLAVTLHNIPEGIAVGVVYAGYLSGSAQIITGSRAGTLPRNCHSGLSGGSDYFHAAAIRGNAEAESLCGRRGAGVYGGNPQAHCCGNPFVTRRKNTVCKGRLASAPIMDSQLGPDSRRNKTGIRLAAPCDLPDF